MPRQKSVLVVGDVMTDIVVQPSGPLAIGADRRASIRLLPGGSGANQAAWLAAEGLRAVFAARVGKRDHAEQAALLADTGVDLALAADEELPTGTLVTLVSPDGERSFLTDRGANERLSRDDLPDSLLDGVDLLHVSGYALFSAGPRAAVMALIGQARRRGMSISVDAASYSFLEEVGEEHFLNWTQGAQLCFANSDEAAALAGSGARGEQLARLTRHYDIVVIKCGAEGAVAGKASSSEQWSAPAVAARVVDSTGAGDAFLAGFLSGYLREEELDSCLRRGVAAGARAVEMLGGRPGN